MEVTNESRANAAQMLESVLYPVSTMWTN